MNDLWNMMNREGAEGSDAEAMDLLQWLLACLRAQYWNYQQSHWQTRGSEFYGNHLLFQRLYESVTEHTDTLAEKMVGFYGPEAVDGLDLGAKFEAWVRRWAEQDDLHLRGLLSEQDFQNASQHIYDTLSEQGEMTLGLDDFLMAMADDHETNEYLLKQVLRQKQASSAWHQMRRENEE